MKHFMIPYFHFWIWKTEWRDSVSEFIDETSQNNQIHLMAYKNIHDGENKWRRQSLYVLTPGTWCDRIKWKYSRCKNLSTLKHLKFFSTELLLRDMKTEKIYQRMCTKSQFIRCLVKVVKTIGGAPSYCPILPVHLVSSVISYKFRRTTCNNWFIIFTNHDHNKVICLSSYKWRRTTYNYWIVIFTNCDFSIAMQNVQLWTLLHRSSTIQKRISQPYH